MNESSLIAKIKKHPRVHSISDERDYRGSQLKDPAVAEYIEARGGENGDGFWIYLKPGWVDNCGTGAHMVHEASPEKAWEYLKAVNKCDCPECRHILGGGK